MGAKRQRLPSLKKDTLVRMREQSQRDLLNRLAKLSDEKLIEEANKGISKTLGLIRKAIDAAKHTGDVLWVMKTRVKKRKELWTDWLVENFDGSPQSARVYMNLSEHWVQLDLGGYLYEEDMTIEKLKKIISKIDAGKEPSKLDKLNEARQDFVQSITKRIGKWSHAELRFWVDHADGDMLFERLNEMREDCGGIAELFLDLDPDVDKREKLLMEHFGDCYDLTAFEKGAILSAVDDDWKDKGKGQRSNRQKHFILAWLVAREDAAEEAAKEPERKRKHKRQMKELRKKYAAALWDDRARGEKRGVLVRQGAVSCNATIAAATSCKGRKSKRHVPSKLARQPLLALRPRLGG